MRYRLLTPLALTVLSVGCIPVTEPVGDIDKAEPDKNLIGNWEDPREKGYFRVDRPEVKGNPKGLMRATHVDAGKKPEDAKEDSTCWFFLAPVGKHTYINVLLRTGKDLNFARLGKEGEYATWAKSDKRGYGIARFELVEDRISFWEEDSTGVEKLMKANQIGKRDDYFHKTASGWLIKHLEKNGPDGLFKETGKFTRVKK